MALGSRLYFGNPSLSNTVRIPESFDIERSRKAVYDWVYKCDLQPSVDEKTNHAGPDETVIQLNEHHYWLYTAVDPETKEIPHTRLYSTTTAALTERFLQKLTERHDLEDAIFSVMEQNISRLHAADLGTNLETGNAEIGTVLKMFFKI